MSTYKTEKFKREDLLGLLYGEESNLEQISDDVIDNTRWSIISELLFKDTETGKAYQVCYSRGATECQDESPFEYDGDMINCTEVEPVEVMKIVYQPVKA